MANLDLGYTSATELACLIRDRVLSPVEVVENSLARIGEVNPRLNCFCAVYPEEALARARVAERAVMAAESLGPLHGLPVAIKDLTPTKGKRTTRGSFAFEDWVPDQDAIVVERLLRAGAIMIGKTTTSEFAVGFTRSPLLGVTRNPWNPERTPGGSSGGSAVAVATGCVPIAEGSDMGGSIRSPASYCGLVGLKPSFGRIPFEIFPSVFDQTPHFGPLARTIDDAALFLDVTKGPDDRDIQSFIPPVRIPIPVPADVRGMRLAFSPGLGYCTVDPEVEANARAALERLQGLGAEVDEVDPAISPDAVIAGSLNSAVYNAAMWGGGLLPRWRDKMSPKVLARIETGLEVGGVELKRTEFARTELWKRLRPILAEYHALLCPTTTTPVPSVDASESDFNTVDEHGHYHGVELTYPFNLVGPCPALSVPSGFFTDGLPTGLQIVGRIHDEVTVLTIGAALENALSWRTRRPPI